MEETETPKSCSTCALSKICWARLALHKIGLDLPLDLLERGVVLAEIYVLVGSKCNEYQSK